MRRATWRIGARMMLAQAVVLLAAIATAAAVAAIVGPSLFHAHMLKADHTPDPSQRMHLEEAFRTANAISLSVAFAAALAIALAVSWYLTRRVQTPLTSLTRAAADVAEGRYAARVPIGTAGPEIDALANAFNTMAARLASTEETRHRLLADLAHELRTPVATLSAYLEGLDDGVTPWDDTTRTVLHDQVTRLTALARDIDAVSRAEEGRLHLDPSRIDVAALVDIAVRGQAEAYAAKGVTIAVEPDGRAVIEADQDRLLQVLTNLLDNARRHTPSGGRVTITWRTHDGAVDVSIADTGDGIPSGQLPHVFERFYRGDTARDREQQGSGIGLTISRAILEAHGGTLAAYSDGTGRGSTFTLTVARVIGPPAGRSSDLTLAPEGA